MNETNRPKSFNTRRGWRVFRQAFTRAGQRQLSKNYTFRVRRFGKDHYFDLGTEKKLAGTKADEIGAFLAVKSNTIEAAVQAFAPDKVERLRRQGVPTVGELCTEFAKVAMALSPVSVRVAQQSMRRIAGFICGQKLMRRKATEEALERWRLAVDAVSLDDFTPQNLMAFRAEMLRQAGTDETLRARATTSSNTYLRCARSILSPKYTKFYDGYILPEKNPFKEVGQLPERPHRYVSTIEVGTLIKAAKKELRRQDPDAYLVFVLSLHCGMRRSEIDHLAWEQVDIESRFIWIRTTEYFRPKAKNSENRIDITKEVTELLARFKRSNPDSPLVLPGEFTGRFPRCRGTFDRLNTWLHLHGVADVKAMHTLRKESGSLMYAATQSIDKAAEFLRNDPRVAREHYIGRKGRLELQL